MPLTLDLSAIGPFTRRFRRPLAASSAALAVLILASLRGPTAAPPSPDAALTLDKDEVAVPVSLALSSDLIALGSAIDIVAVPDLGGGARIVARDARVIRASSQGGFGASPGATIVVAVTAGEALELADAGAAGTLTALIHAGP